MATARDYGSAELTQPQAEFWLEEAQDVSPLDASKKAIVGERRDLTLSAAFAHLVKGNIGVGIWSLPFHFARVGPSMGLTLLGVVIGQVLIGNLLLLSVQSKVAQRRGDGTNARPLAFEDLGFEVFGSFGRRAIQIAILSFLLGACAVFVSMIASNMRAFWPGMARDTAVVVVGLLCGVLALLPDLRSLTPLSIFGNASMLFVLGGVLYASIMRLSAGGVVPIVPTGSMHSLIACVSAGFYSFEGITFVLPVGNAVKSESSPRYPALLTVASVAVAMCYLIVGFLGGTAFPEIDTASITAYLVREPLMDSVFMNQMFAVMSSLVSMSVLATFPLPLHFAMQVSDPILGLTSPTNKLMARLSAVAACVMLDLALPRLELVISFVGGAAGAVLAGAPYMLHAKLLLEEEKRPGSSLADTCRWTSLLLLDFVLTLFCGTVMVLGLYDSAVQWNMWSVVAVNEL